jgi:hypothetical protein
MDKIINNVLFALLKVIFVPGCYDNSNIQVSHN